MHHLKFLLTALAVAALAAADGRAAAPEQDRSKFRAHKAPQTGRYIVVLNEGMHEDNVPIVARTLIEKHRGKPLHLYKKALKGFAAQMSEADAKALSADARVAYVEEDTVIKASAIVQSSPDWGLDRIDQRQLPTDGSYEYEADGRTVHMYIIDSGVRTSHTEFSGRATQVYSAYQAPNGEQDCHGHGTMVASLAAGRTAGVAKSALIHSVRVLGCDGTGYWSDAINGIDWMTANHVKPAVANMSIAGDPNASLRDAVQGALDAGITFVAAAGNNGADACSFAPGSLTNALIVGNVDQQDRREYTSNFGPCVDLWAPGTSIRAASNTADAEYAYASGTSLSSPFVAGGAALYLQRTPAALPDEVTEAILNTATRDELLDIGALSPNLALYTPALGDRTPPSVALSRPADRAMVSGTVDILANASDNLQVTSVEFFYGDTLIATDSTAPYSARWVTTSLATGSYKLTAVAVDIGGNVRTSLAHTVTVDNGGTATTRDAFASIQAESYDAMFGVQATSSHVGYVDGGDWLKFSAVDFESGAQAVDVRVAVAADYAGKQIQFRLDSTSGPLVGVLTVNSTGSWSTFTSQRASISGATGIHDLYLVFAGGSGVGNIDALAFSAITASAPSSGTTELSPSGWVASASASYTPASRALDRNAAYKWQNGRSQATSNDYIQADFGAARAFSHIVLDHAGHTNDYPRTYRVEVSDDGAAWQVVHNGTGTAGQTQITLPSTYTRRFVRITETGTTGSAWFTVNELRVFGSSVSTQTQSVDAGEVTPSGWVASASASYSPPLRAIDRNTAYRWQNGRAQSTSNDYIQVDLGSARTFNRIVLDHAGSSNDFPAAYRVDVSDDGSTWTTVRTGNGTASATTIVLPSTYTKRYVRVTETGASGSNWFTVNELRLFND